MSAERRNLMIGTAGHVDHGKTALIRMLTGCETDTLSEEKERGLTIDLGFAPCRLSGDRVVGIVDVPGHVDFIRNMVAGAHGLDVVMFVVAADDGIMPQTLEHLHILTLMGLRHGIVALTKIDLVEEQQRGERINDLRRLFAGTFLEQAAICPLSNSTGAGFDQFFEALNHVVEKCGNRPSGGLFRMWVEDVFTIRGSGTVITGIPMGGVVRTGDRLRVLPSGLTGRVRRMQVYGEDSAFARAGECTAINVPELEHREIRRGMVLTESNELEAVTMLEAELEVLMSVKGSIRDNAEVQLHIGTAAVSAQVAMLERGSMSGGEKQFVQVRLAEAVPATTGERFVLRANVPGSGLTTIGGGRVLGASSLRLRRKKPWTLERLAARRQAMGDARQWCELMVKESSEPLPLEQVAGKCFMPSAELEPILKSLQTEGAVIQTAAGDFLHHSLIKETGEKLVALLGSFHAANPQRAAMEQAELLTAAGVNPEVFEQAIQRLIGADKIVRVGTGFAQKGWSAKLSTPEQTLAEKVAEEFQRAGWTSPAIPDLALKLGAPMPRLQIAIGSLRERGILAKLDEQIYMHREAIEAGKQKALALFAKAASFSTMEFRDALGVSRKYAVPLLDHLDATRFTVRNGHHRTPGVEAKRRLNG